MEPVSTLAEISRILAPGGVFATVDYDWPPICGVEAEVAFLRLVGLADSIEASEPALHDASVKWPKENHLRNIAQSGHFRYARELLFENEERCTAKRLVDLALSQSDIQSILKRCPERIQPEIDRFRRTLSGIFGDRDFTVGFCYHMRLGVK
jgi:SAM-dependent methyltransferase